MFFFFRAYRRLERLGGKPLILLQPQSPLNLVTRCWRLRFFIWNLTYKTLIYLNSFVGFRFTHSRQNTFVTLFHKSQFYYYTNFTVSYGLILKVFTAKTPDAPYFKLTRRVTGLLFKFLKRLRFRGLLVQIDKWFLGLGFLLRKLITTSRFFSVVFKPKWVFDRFMRKRFRRLKKKLVKKIY